MNRRQFIQAAMAAVAASYAGGTFELDHSRLVWRETTFDYGRYYGLAVEYTSNIGELHGISIRLPIYPHSSRLSSPISSDKVSDEFPIAKERKEMMKQKLLEWLEQNV